MTDIGSANTAFSLEYETFDARHYELFMRTWRGYIAKGNAKPLREDQLRLLYAANPAGSSVITVIEDDGVWIGAISAIATNILRPDGAVTKAYQLGDFMVDPKFQGRGFGGKLARELTRFLVAMDAPTYAFPNTRSVGVFLKQSYAELRTVPIVAYPLLPAALFTNPGPKTSLRDLSLEEACGLADALIGQPSTRARIQKSGAYLLWRYGQMRDSGDYVFTSVESSGNSAPSLVVWSPFRYRKIPVQVVVDTLGEGETALREIASRGMRRGAWFGVSNVEAGSGWRLPPLSVRVPRRFDPRPARLLVPPGNAVSAGLVSDCLFTTGDWMGF